MSTVKARLTQEDGLAIKSATLSIPEAIENWIRLMGDVDFQLINPNTQRLAPLVYHRLKDQQGVTERERLRGAYKYAWAKNHRLLNALKPIFTELNELEINYQVIKGMAVQLTLGFVGARVVGDVDMVVSQKDVEVVRIIFERNGFRCNSDSGCKRHSRSAAFEALNFNLGENHVDMHIAESKDPKILLALMLDLSPNLIEYLGTKIPIPNPELLLLHSAFHGHQAVSDTDLVQAIADISLLAPVCDPRKLTELAGQTKTYSDLWHVSSEAATVDIALPKFTAKSGRSRNKNVALPVLKARGVGRKVQKVPALVKDRYRGNATTRHILGRFPGRKVAYALWLSAGQFSALERVAMSRERGFLKAPVEALKSETLLRPFMDQAPELVEATNLAEETLDYRFSIRVKPGIRALLLSLDSDYLDMCDAFLYSNGRPISRIVAGDTTFREVTIRSPLEVNEISIRPTSNVCTECFRSLTDLRVKIRYED